MAGDDTTEICGFTDAKIPLGMRSKKRSLASWKVWRRHWCQIRKLGANFGLEILLDHGVGSRLSTDSNASSSGSIRIPADAIVCRTESRSKPYAFGIFPAKERKPLIYLAASSESETQRWMANIRQLLRPRRHRFMEGTFNVSMVDNAHSRSAGLTGLYGDMVASRSGVYVKDVHTGEIVETFDWKDTDSVHLACSGREEDVKRICVVHTTKGFRCGLGELHIFCLDAPLLLLDLIRQGRGPRQHRAHLTQRPLSLSEGDLRLVAQQQHQQQQQQQQQHQREHSCKERKGQGNTLRRQHTFQTIKHKITINVINVGLGLLSSSRAGSETKLINDVEKDRILDKMDATYNKRAVDNVYHSNPKSTTRLEQTVCSSLEELEEPSLRRVSNISVASGIYEEILDDFVSTRTLRRVPSELYEDLGDIILHSSEKLEPPPLPPRQRCGSGSTRNGSVSGDDGLDSEGDTRSATPSMQDDSTPTPEDLKNPPSESEDRMIGQIDQSEYVQMSPRPRDIAARELQQQVQLENMYMVMR
ncbi:uncharacterized protein LOC106645838 isoform X2 [Copidosoma floridanum]|nr:uncharacterized protein LOC106645838 isoform X2 [Copidosoma floridanum]XP_023246673.1 uncharacterized protein LOC106645838 isoform X2 [Copidosoma floridanum]